MGKPLLTSLLVVYLAFCSRLITQAGPAPQARQLLQTISNSELIVVGRITLVTPDPTRHVSKNQLPWIVGLNEPGDYTFEIVSTLRGKCAASLRLFLPQIDASVYGRAKPKIEKGAFALLFLKSERDSSGPHWIATDPMRPLLVLGANPKPQDAVEVKKDIVTRIVNIILASASDSTLRHANIYAMRGIVNTSIPQALMKYADDPDRDTRAAILFCLAANQQSQIIPRIAQLEGEVYGEHGGVDVIFALQLYKTPDAVPYLNPLLFDVDVYTRINAVAVLRDIGNQTSIPYFYAALNDSNSDVVYDAYAGLCRLIPALGELKPAPEFYAHQNSMLAPYYAWWHDELDGKHLPKPY